MDYLLSLRLLNPVFDSVLLEQGMVDYPMFFLLLSARNDLGYLPETQGYSGLVYENYSLSDPLKVDLRF